MVEHFLVPLPDEKSGGGGFYTPFRAGTEASLTVVVNGAATVELEWGDGATTTATVRNRAATLAHTYRLPGRLAIRAHAIAPCGARAAPARLTLPVPPACRDALGAGLLGGGSCDPELGRLRLAFAGLSTLATSLITGCRDYNEPPRLVEPEAPQATASACVAPSGPPPVAGRLPVAPGGRLTVTLGARATRLTARLERAGRRVGPPLRARRRDPAGRRWALRLPRELRAADRIGFRASRGGPTNRFVAGLRAR